MESQIDHLATTLGLSAPTVPGAVQQANELLGIKPEGTLTQQVAKLWKAVVGTGISSGGTTFETLNPGEFSTDTKPLAVGKLATVRASAWLASAPPPAKPFWSTDAPGQHQWTPGADGWTAKSAFSFTAGAGSVVAGWERGVDGMHVGEIRQIKVPAAEGYGAKGFRSWRVPPNADLIFEIELLAVAGAGSEDDESSTTFAPTGHWRPVATGAPRPALSDLPLGQSASDQALIHI